MGIAPRPTASCRVNLEGDRVRLAVAGELTLASAYPLITELHRAAPLARRCAVDVVDVESITPGGLEALEEVLDAARTLFCAVTLVQ